MDHLAL
jgi:hypothetical protein